MTKLLYSLDEAADLCSMSRKSFERHVLPNIRVVRVGGSVRRKTLIPRDELEQYINQRAALLIEGGGVLA